MNGFDLSDGLLTEGDIVSLSAGLIVDKQKLYDTANGANHYFYPRAKSALYLLITPIRFGSWLQTARNQSMVDTEIIQVIQFLNSISGLCVSRSRSGKVRLAMLRGNRLRYGLKSQVLGRRWPVNITNLFMAINYSMYPLVIVMIMTGFLLYGAGLSGMSAFQYTAAVIVMFWLTTVLHELAHVAFVRKNKDSVIVQKGLRFGILHPRLQNSRELASSLMGPITGIAAAIFLGYGLEILSGDKGYFVIGIALGIVHAWSWLPSFGDGSTIKDLMKPYKRKTIWE